MAERRQSTSENHINRVRLILLASVVSAVVLIYVFVLLQMQVLNSYVYQKRAKDVTQRSDVLHAQRGSIYDRNYETPIASNEDSFAVNIIPAEVEKGRFDSLFLELSKILDISVEEIEERVPINMRGYFQPIELKSNVPYSNIIFLAEHAEKFKGITWLNKPARKYNDNDLFSHIVGYVGNITRDELQVLYNKGYTLGDVVGKAGIEKHYDEILSGEDGRRYRTVDVKGRDVNENEFSETPPELGKNIVLTLDRDIQRLSQRALGKRNGAVVVLKPATGEILSMVSYPTFNPNDFYSSEARRIFNERSLDPNFPFINRAVQSIYPPASTFKIMMTAAVLEEQLISPDVTIQCDGNIFYGDRIFNCWKRSGHGLLDMKTALAESCDVYFYTIGKEYLGVERIFDYSKLFGFGERTGIDLPGEVKGIVPNPEWKKQIYNSSWLGGDTVNMSIGQGFLAVTPLQVANMLALVVNEGFVYKPHLLKDIRDPVTGKILEKHEPELLYSLQMTKESFSLIKESLRFAVTDGTAKYEITTEAVEVSGKTGTGEIGVQDRFHSWFAAFGPYNAENPEDSIVVVVLVEATNEWESWAPKATNFIFQGIFADQTYEEAVLTMRPWYLRLPEEF